MKTSTILLCLAPTIALAVEADPQIPPAVSPTPSLPNANPPAPLPEIPMPSNAEQHAELRKIRTLLEIQDTTDATRVQDQLPEPASGRIGLAASTGETKALRARSEGTLGQTPWIGMAIGLTCTALAAVMLG
ncbi:uncharacterized protein AKAW2_60126A [Aspergillus luchuensis]|uniref:Uncharacterized protein n=4 Tax=Aspergillus subgen. Circumdati TaxID=2720871 RepID=A0A8G1R3L3_9EURO|nr:uncharacterized protein BO83DRAFT_154043 [Aspergillus eucalypticola CBS 122712]XP_025516560.1 hypothetical protein BO85DRAFT_437786 [Aspergillus piperis CBS 112811]XP_041545624.1 uncharacterized protein AKAW2_60126A [Aspergillus luchuensis]GAA91507.1 similar to An15g06560 [Aspergillus luchuensis IFO 4308]PWY63570.1 hypothetical protein BO83DRAFT_154043 [Aspergillus eucalypticola CBS 122712]RAH58638.1 hypothetical protein BO85DRAFT_437786 [Aspergillus piperis CBS 112811]BCS01862.1 hypotheti